MATTDLPSNSPLSSQAPASSPYSAEEAKELQFGQVWRDAGTPAQRSDPASRPSLADTGPDGGRRKSSIQFNTAPAEDTIRRESVALGRQPSIVKSRMASPPPPVTYQRGVAFDTFSTPDAAAEAFTLQYKHNNFNYTPRTRTFVCGTDAKDYSAYALEWMLDELVDDGDHVVCLRVIEEKSSEQRHHRAEAERLLESVVQKNSVEQKAIQMTMELVVGKVTDVIQSMIQLYEPVAIVVGTRGRNLTGMQGLMPGSVSKYCLQRSPVPVIVVRPSSKRTKKKRLQQENGRGTYTSRLNMAQNGGGKHILDRSINDTFETLPIEQDEVEKVIGAPRKSILRNRHYGGPLEKVSDPTGNETEEEDAPQHFALPIGFLSTATAPQADLAMQNPMIAALVEKWDDDTPRAGSRAESPKPGSRVDPESASTEDDHGDDSLGVPTIVEEKRPSTRSQVPWLNSILRAPDTPNVRAERSRSRSGRSPSR